MIGFAPLLQLPLFMGMARDDLQQIVAHTKFDFFKRPADSKVISEGDRCEAVVILTRKEGENPTDYSRMKMLVNVTYRSKYPRMATALLKRKDVYEKQMEDLREMERMGKVFIIRPTQAGIGHFENNPEKLGSFYQHGIDVMKQEMERLRGFLSE